LNHVDGLTPILLHFYLLLRSATQRAGSVGLRPQPLNRCRHLILIRHDRRPDGGIVVNVLRHHLQHLGKTDQSNKCRVEALLLGTSGQLGEGQVTVLRQPVVYVEDLLRIRGGGSDLGEKRVGVKSDWSQQLIQLLRCRRWRSLRLKIGSKTLKEDKDDEQKNCG
jgi:hypothetical protein